MNNKNYASITVLITTMLIPQLFFWWLAPQSADSYWSVFACGTLLTLIIPAIAFGVYLNSSIRETAGLMVVSGVMELVTIISSVVLLVFNLSLRTSLFVYAILLVFSLMAEVPIIHSVLRERSGQGYTDLPTVDYRLMNTSEESRIPVDHPQRAISRTPSNVDRPVSPSDWKKPLPRRY